MRLYLFSTLFFLALLFLFDGWRGRGDEKSFPPPVEFIEIKVVENRSLPLTEVASSSPVVSQEIETRELSSFPKVDLVEELFLLDSKTFPFVETITYKSRVPWKQGSLAWVVDYANHFKTSRHFIARSLNGRPEYMQQEAKDGDRFNVLSLEYPFHFHLLLDLSRRVLWLGAFEEETGQVDWIKNYSVCIGRPDESRGSGYLTPIGTYLLGDRIAVYTTDSRGYYQGEKADMIAHFGTRWIPFEKEIKGCSAPAKSYGIHGVPWVKAGDEWKEETSSVSEAESDGCIRLKTSDMEELYAIVSSRPSATTIEITHDYAKADRHP